MQEIKNNLATLQNKITRLASHPVSLIAVSKAFPESYIRVALEAGHRVFGENKIQEAQQKWQTLKADYPDSKLHFIGTLQSNKARLAVSLCDVIHSLDRPRLAHALAEESQKQGRTPRLFVQLNTGGEEQKSGIPPAEAEAFIRHCRQDYDLNIVGLMCLPPRGEDPVPHFALLAKIAKDNGLPALSMGMSGDYAQALACGATHIRLGTAIFGQRP